MNEQKDKISIIVPVYNAEKYIERCLLSIINQTYANLEIIVVNDGSEDNSLEIVKGIQRSDKRIIIIDKENSGVSDSRNIGIKNATGNFIGFVDADDYLEKEMYEELITSLKENNADISMCAFNFIKDNEQVPEKFPWEHEIRNFNSQEINNELLPMYISKLKKDKRFIWGMVWRMLFSKKLIENIMFDQKIRIAEDLLFVIDSFSKCTKLCVLNKVLYNYVFYSDSSTGKYKEDLSESNETFHRKLEKKLIEIGFFSKNLIRYQLNKNIMYTTSISNIVKDNESNLKKMKYNIENILIEFNNDKYINKNILKELTFSRKVLFYLMKWKCSLIITLIFIAKDKIRRRK